MDANNTRYHLLLGQADWARCESHHLEWREEDGTVALESKLFLFREPKPDQILTPEHRRGAARDQFGNWYWIGPDERSIRVLPNGASQSQHYWTASDREPEPSPTGDFQPETPPAPTAPLELRGLTITAHHYLVVGVIDPAGLLIFDLHAGGPPYQVLWPQDIPFVPFDMAPAPGGGLWILDRENARYWGLDERFRIFTREQPEVEIKPGETEYFHELGEGPWDRPPRTFPTGISLELASPLAEDAPLAIEALPDGTVLILEAGGQQGGSQVHRYRFAQKLGSAALTIPASLMEDGHDRLLHGHDLAFLPSPHQAGQGELYVVSTNSNQSFAFGLTVAEETLELTILERYLPLRRYGGLALVAVEGEVYYDYREQWLPLTAQQRPRFEQAGVLETPIFDGKEPDCVWHRLFIDGCIPGESGVLVESRSAEDPEQLEAAPWFAEPTPYLRGQGSELPYNQPFPGRREDGAGTWELLLQRARGRYIQLRLTLTGNGRTTPRLRALRVYYPRFSYLKEYLPKVYQEDAQSASFLERFLGNVEGLYTALEDRIAHVQLLFDVRTAPPEYLDWLAGWFDLMLDQGWEVSRRRLFIAHAHELFNQKGTVPGLIRAIRLATDPCPDEALFEEDLSTQRPGQAPYSVRIQEWFITRRIAGSMAAVPADLPVYQEYLARRYRRVEELNRAWGVHPGYSSFSQVKLPSSPPEGPALLDWQQFEAHYLPTVRSAHRFTVLMPTAAVYGRTDGRAPTLELVRRIVALEKPAHTEFEVQEYWALFRVGDARLGYDTLLDTGSRLSPAIAGQAVLAGSYLPAPHPWNIPDRTVIGRDRVGENPKL